MPARSGDGNSGATTHLEHLEEHNKRNRKEEKEMEAKYEETGGEIHEVCMADR